MTTVYRTNRLIWFILTTLLLILMTSTAFSQDNVPLETPGTTTIINVNVITMVNEDILENQTVIIEGDRITAIALADEVTIPDDAEVIDGAGKYLIPGLADMHYHSDNDPNAITVPLAFGVTTVRSLNVAPDEIERSQAVTNGDLFGAHMYTAWSIAAAPPGSEFIPMIRGIQILIGLGVGIVIFIIISVARRFTDNIVKQMALWKWSLAWFIGIVLLSTVGTFTGFIPEDFAYIMIAGDTATVSPRRGEQIVRRQSAAGADAIKTNLALSRDVFDTIVRVAGEEGLPVIGHVSQPVGVEHYLNSGGEIQHAGEIAPFVSANSPHDNPTQKFDLELIDENLPRVVELHVTNNAPHTPTLVINHYIYQMIDEGRFETYFDRLELASMPPYLQKDSRGVEFVRSQFTADDAPYLEKFITYQNRLVHDLHDAGVTILAGTDVTALPGTVWGESLLTELELLVAAGLTPYEALEAATISPATVMGDADEWGTVEVGKRADLVLLSANPLEDISNTRAIVGVSVRGRWLDTGALQQLLDDAAALYQNEA